MKVYKFHHLLIRNCITILFFDFFMSFGFPDQAILLSSNKITLLAKLIKEEMSCVIVIALTPSYLTDL